MEDSRHIFRFKPPVKASRAQIDRLLQDIRRAFVYYKIEAEELNQELVGLVFEPVQKGTVPDWKAVDHKLEPLIIFLLNEIR